MWVLDAGRFHSVAMAPSRAESTRGPRWGAGAARLRCLPGAPTPGEVPGELSTPTSEHPSPAQQVHAAWGPAGVALGRWTGKQLSCLDGTGRHGRGGCARAECPGCCWPQASGLPQEHVPPPPPPPFPAVAVRFPLSPASEDSKVRQCPSPTPSHQAANQASAPQPTNPERGSRTRLREALFSGRGDPRGLRPGLGRCPGATVLSCVFSRPI